MGFELAALFVTAVLCSAALAHLLHPLLVRYALARPNARSSHREPTPQGGGIAVIGAVTIVLAAAAALAPTYFTDLFRLSVVLASAVALAAVGAFDDIRPLGPLSRLLLQTIFVSIVIAMLSADQRILPLIPWWAERTLLIVALVWFVNLVNFMDGIDWMTVAEAVPIAAALAVFGLIGGLPSDATVVSLALCGAMAGFAPFNKPVARLFLGDVGSLPIGLLLGWLLTVLAAKHLSAALLLPLYYLADATITLLQRLVRGEKIMQAHRNHYYQRAFDGGLTVEQIVGRVFAVNVALAGFATLTLLDGTPLIQAISLTAGGVLVAALLWGFDRRKMTNSV